MTDRATRSWAMPALLPLFALCSIAGSGSSVFGATLPAEKSEAAVEAEIQFAKGLASDWSFVDLAESVLDRVEKEGVPRSMTDKFELVKCDVVAEGAANEKDPVRRTELFERALDAYEGFLEQNSYSEQRANANSAYVATANNLSRSLAIQLEEALGEEATAIRTRRQEVLEGALGKANEEISNLVSIPKRDRAQADTVRLFMLYLNKGKMLSDLAELFNNAGSDGSTFFSDAISALEELIFAAGEGTPPGFHGYIEIGRVNLKRGAPEDAAAYLSAVIDGTIPKDLKEWELLIKERELNDADKVVLFSFLQKAMEPLVDAFLATGDMQALTEYSLHYYNTQRREGFTFDPQGHMSMLAVARGLLESSGFVGGNLTQGEGRWFATVEEMNSAGFKSRRETTDTTDLALRIAQNVNEENKGTSLQLLAQKLISEIITRPGVVVSPEVLFDAAQGIYYDTDYTAALTAYHRVLGSLEGQDSSKRIEFGARTMNGIGNCYRKLEQPLLAAMAFREGCTTWLGDIEFDGKNANGYYKMMQNIEGPAVLDKDVLTELVNNAQDLVAQLSENNKDEVRYNMGKQAQRKRNWDDAIREYSQIAVDTAWWEKGIVDIAVCRFRDGDASGALQGFNEYLEVFLKDTDRSQTESPIRLAKRREASATAEFYRGFITFTEAKANNDLTLFGKVVELLTGYADKYEEQPSLAAWSMNMVVQSHLKLGDTAKARTEMTALTASYSEDKRAGEASLIFYNTLLRKERESTDTAEQMTLLREMAEHLERGNSTGKPKLSSQQNEAKHWFDLSEWAKCEKVALKILNKYGDDPAQEKFMRTILKPRLGKSLLYQGRMAEAKEVLTSLVMDEADPAPKSTVLAWVDSVIGIVDGTGTKVQVSPGAGGDEEEFTLLTKRLNSYSASGDKWISCDWYALKFQLIYAYQVWGQQDGRKIDAAKAQLLTIQGEVSATFKTVEDVCEEAEGATAELAAKYGNGALRNCYKWIAKELR
ncbi:MAG: hypothetical protein ACI835_000034 [Planctomycetota bacterium]|jgi:hypothetical protein